MFDFLLPAHVKKGKLLLEGVKKFIHQHRDLMTEDRIAQVEQARADYAAVLETRDAEQLAEEEKRLLAACEKAVPDYKSDPIRENLEVIIVAIVVALGIRSYIVQPFKIPTASMQPTLNGIVAKSIPATTELPNIVSKAWQLVWSGTNYTELRAPEASGPLAIVAVRQQAFAMLFTRTIVTFSNGETSWCYAPANKLFGELWLPENGGSPAVGLPATDSFTRDGLNLPVRPGALLARGQLDTGDQVLVDKVSYHFRQPARGEAFVFSTKGINGIYNSMVQQASANHLPPPAEDETQHYIKRLVGLPNDVIEIDSPLMYINGQEAKEYGMQHVMHFTGDQKANFQSNQYHGYTNQGVSLSKAEMDTEQTQRDGHNTMTYRLHDKQYMACGDNSGHSSDSRYWGHVPQENLVGPALLVYWPFSPHAGLIK